MRKYPQTKNYPPAALERSDSGRGKLKTDKGFTLIELLVSIAIIALLSALVIVSISGINAKKRDATRIAHLKELNNALNLYNNSVMHYPIYEGPITGSDAVSEALEDTGAIAKTPLDPLNSGVYVFSYSSKGDSFTIGFCLETDSIKEYRKGCGNKISP